MTIETQLFGKVEVNEDKIIVFNDGIIGFPDLKRFTLMLGDENSDSKRVFWLQSLDDVEFAMPVVDPFAIFEEYNPVVEDEWFKALGEHTEEDLIVFLTMAVPEDITKMTVNQKAPLVINTKMHRACQIIIDGEEYQVRCPVYDILKSRSQKAGE